MTSIPRSSSSRICPFSSDDADLVVADVDGAFRRPAHVGNLQRAEDPHPGRDGRVVPVGVDDHASRISSSDDLISRRNCDATDMEQGSDVPKLALTLACWNYDRTRALLEGRVTPEGVDLNCLTFRSRRHFSGCCATVSSTSRRCRSRRMCCRSSTRTVRLSRSRCFRRGCSGTPRIYVHARQRHHRTATARRAESRQSRIPDDGGGLDPRHPRRRVRRPDRQRHLLHRR